MKPFFKKSIGPSLVLVLLIEMLFAHGQPHWFLATLAFVIINAIAYAAFRLLKPRVTSPSS